MRFDPDSGALLPESYIKLVPIGQYVEKPGHVRKAGLLVCCTGTGTALHKAFARKLLDNIQRFLTVQVAVPADRVRTMTMVERPSVTPRVAAYSRAATAARVEIFTLE